MGDIGRKILVGGIVALLGAVAPAVLMIVGLVANGIANLMKFGQLVINLFAKTGKSSNVLTEQLNYMNSEQIEAYAVAAALDQVHNRLVQTFNAEAASVDLLTAAYGRAIDRQRQMMMGKVVGTPGAGPSKAGGTGGKVPGYADGIVSVPGPKGAGDIMPAMLSPGEAVIPTKQAQKYSALIQGIIRDDIPGFSRGTPKDGPAPKWYKPDFATQETHVQTALPKTPEVLAELDKLIPGIARLNDEMLDLIFIVGDLTATKTKELNQEAKGAGFTNEEAVRGASFEEKRSHAQSRFTEEWDRTEGQGFTNVGIRAKQAGQLEDTPEVDDSLRKLDEAVGERVAGRIAQVGADEMSEPGWLDRLIAEVTDEVIADMQNSKNKSDQQVAKAMKERKATPVAARTDGIQDKVTDPVTGKPAKNQDRAFEILEERGKVTRVEGQSGLVGTDKDGQATGVRVARQSSSGGMRSTSIGRGFTEKGILGGTHEDVTRKVGVRTNATSTIQPASDVFEGDEATFIGEEIARKLREDAIEGMEQTAETNSESKRTRKIGEDTVDGYINALEEGVPKAKEVGERQAEAAAEKSKKKKPTSPADDPRNQARKQDFDASKKEMIRRQKMKDYGTEGDVTAEMRWRRKAAQARERQLQREMKAAQQEQVLTVQKQRVTNAQQKDVKKQGIVARLQERMLARKQQRLAREAKLATQETAMDSARMAKPRGLVSPGMKMGGAGMLASTGMMMASQAPGKVGETAQKLVGPMMSLSLILPLLTSKIGIVIAIIGAVVATFMYFNNSINKAARESMELTKALGAGSDAIQNFAKAAGKVTAGEILDRRAATEGQTFQLQPGETSFGEAFIQSDEGEALLQSLSKAAESGDMRQIQQQIISQMATAVASGALSAGQARSVVEQLAKQMGNYRFGIEVNSKLIDLLGPDGENLLEDPLAIRVRLVAETGEAIAMMSDSLGPAVAKAGKDSGMAFGRNLAIGAAAGGGAVALASQMSGKIDAYMWKQARKIGGRFAVRMAASIGAGGVTAGVGAIVGGVLSLGMTVFDVAKAFKEVGVAAGGVVATSVIALQQQKEMLASLQLEYEQRIQTALAADDLTEAMRLQNEYLEARQTLLEASAQVMQQISDSYNQAGFFGQRAMDKSLDDLLSQMKKDDVLQQQLINSAMQSLQSATAGLFSDGISRDTAYQIKLMIASDDLSPAEVNSLLQADPRTIERFVNVATNLGVAEGNRALQVMNLFEDPQQRAQFLINVDTQEDANAQRYIDIFQEISRVGNVANLDMVMGFYLENPEEAEMLFNDINEIRRIAAEEGPLEIEAYLHLFDNPEAQEALLAFSDEFAELPKEDQVTYIQTFRTIFQTEGTPMFEQELEMFRQTSGNRGATGADMASASASRLVGARQARGGTGADEPMEESGGGSKREQKTAASALDDLVRRLRNVQQNQINVTTGFKDSANMINSLFGSGKSGSMFSGIEQDMRKLGAGQDLISLIAGMDPEVFERRKHELFTFDGAGNIKGFTNTLVNLGRAMRQIALGEFQSQQQSTIQTTTDQVIAMRKLVGAGLTATEAYNAVQDAAVASAIAHEKNAGTLRELADATKEATKLTQAFAAAQAVAAKNQETANLKDTLAFAQANFGALTEAQKDLVMTDTNIQALIQANVDNETLMQALRDAEEKAQIELEIKKLTFAGRLEIFEEGFNKAMEKFQVLETEIRIDFKAKKDPFLDVIKQAEQDIADIRNRAGGLGDLEAELQRISWEEEKINKRYDRRLEALSVIEKINNRINQRQQSQLDVAEALSRGDIAAAARAAQEARQKAAEASQQAKRDRLEKARQNDLSKVVGRSGLNREAIEERVRDLQIEIFNIEQDRIRPAARSVELLERQEELAVEALTVLGKTRDEWEKTKNEIDLARVSTDEYKQAIQDALDIVEDILEYWNQIEDQKAQLIIEEVFIPATREEADGVAGPAIADDPQDGDGGGGGSRSGSRGGGAGGGPPVLPDEADFNEGEPAPDPEEAGKGWGSKFLKGVAAIAIGTYNVFLKPLVDGLMEKLQPIIQWFEDLWEEITRLWNKWVVEPITAAAKWFDEEVIQPIREGFEKVFDWFNSDKTIEEMIQDVEDAWGVAIENVLEWWNGIAEWFEDLGSNISSFVTEDIPNWFGEAVEKGKEWLEGVIDWFKELPEKIGNAAGNLWSEIKGIGEWFEEKWEDAKAWVADIPNKIGNAAGDLWSGVKGIGEWLEEKWEDAKSWFADLPYNVGYAIGYLWGSVLNIKDWLVEKWEDAKTWLAEMPSKVAAAASNWWEEQKTMLAWFGEKWDEAVAWVKDIPNKVAAAASDWWEEQKTMLAWFGEKWDEAVAWVKDIPNKVASAAGDWWEKQKTMLAWLGEKWDEAVAWVKDIPSKVKEAAGNWWEEQKTMLAWLGEKWNEAVSWIRDIPNKVRQTASDWWARTKGIREWAIEKWNEAVAWFRDIPNKVKTAAGNIWNNIQNMSSYLADRAKELEDWIKDLPSKIRNWARGIWDGFWAGFTKGKNDAAGGNIGGLVAGGGFRRNNGGLIYRNNGGPVKYSGGGWVSGFGNYDNVPAMLTPGEFVIRKESVDKYGLGMMKLLNNGLFKVPRVTAPEFNTSDLQKMSNMVPGNTTPANSVYNNTYSISVNVKSEANPEQIARTVIGQIKSVDSQRIRGSRL
jgi:hypothetical protein